MVALASTTTGTFLLFYGRDGAGWHGPTPLVADGQLVSGVTGNPGFLQGTYGNQGNYEMVVPLGDHLSHYWRDNDAAGYPWHGPIELPPPVHGSQGPGVFALPVTFTAATALQSSIGPGNLDVVALASTTTGTFLLFYGRDGAGWHGPTPLVADGQQVSGVTGNPGFLQGTYGNQGNYEMVAPLGDHLSHYWRDNDAAGYRGTGPSSFPHQPTDPSRCPLRSGPSASSKPTSETIRPSSSPPPPSTQPGNGFCWAIPGAPADGTAPTCSPPMGTRSTGSPDRTDSSPTNTDPSPPNSHHPGDR